MATDTTRHNRRRCRHDRGARRLAPPFEASAVLCDSLFRHFSRAVVGRGSVDRESDPGSDTGPRRDGAGQSRRRRRARRAHADQHDASGDQPDRRRAARGAARLFHGTQRKGRTPTSIRWSSSCGRSPVSPGFRSALFIFGIGDVLPVFIMVYVAFFPLLLNTIAGVRNVDRKLVNAARTMGVGRWRAAAPGHRAGGVAHRDGRLSSCLRRRVGGDHRRRADRLAERARLRHRMVSAAPDEPEGVRASSP